MIDLETMRQRFDSSPFAMYLGMRIVKLERGYASVEMELKKDYLTWDNLVQGGIISSLMDQAFGYSLNTLDNIHVAVQLSVNFLGAARVGDTITAESKVVHAGKSMGVCEMTVADSRGKVIARAMGTTVSRGPRTQ